MAHSKTLFLFEFFLAEPIYVIGDNPFEINQKEGRFEKFVASTIKQPITQQAQYEDNLMFIMGGEIYAFGNSTYNELGSTQPKIFDPIQKVTFYANLDTTEQPRMISIGYRHSMVLLKNGSLYWQGQNPLTGVATKPTQIYKNVQNVVASGEKVLGIGSAYKTDYIVTDKTVYWFWNCAKYLCGTTDGSLDVSGQFDENTFRPPLDSAGNSVNPTALKMPEQIFVKNMTYSQTFILIKDYNTYYHAFGSLPCYPNQDVQYTPMDIRLHNDSANFNNRFLRLNPAQNSLLYVTDGNRTYFCGDDRRYSLASDQTIEIVGSFSGDVLDVAAGPAGWYLLTSDGFYVYGTLQLGTNSVLTKYGWYKFQDVRKMNRIAAGTNYIFLYNDVSVAPTDDSKSKLSDRTKIFIVVGVCMVPLAIMLGLLIWVINVCERKYEAIAQKEEMKLAKQE